MPRGANFIIMSIVTTTVEKLLSLSDSALLEKAYSLGLTKDYYTSMLHYGKWKDSYESSPMCSDTKRNVAKWTAVNQLAADKTPISVRLEALDLSANQDPENPMNIFHYGHNAFALGYDAFSDYIKKCVAGALPDDGNLYKIFISMGDNNELVLIQDRAYVIGNACDVGGIGYGYIATPNTGQGALTVWYMPRIAKYNHKGLLKSRR